MIIFTKYMITGKYINIYDYYMITVLIFGKSWDSLGDGRNFFLP